MRAAANFRYECHGKGNSAILPDTVYQTGATGLPHVCVECETEAKELRSQDMAHSITGRGREK